MAELWYGGVDLSDIQTQHYGFVPVPDIADNATLFVELTIEVVALVHTNAPGLGAGRTLGASLDSLMELLQEPKQKLFFRVGNDLVVESPPRFPDGSQMECDCKDGPFADARVLAIHNDTSAFVKFKVKTYLNSNDNFILSNVWGCQNDVDDTGYTTRTIRGRAVFRSDFLRHFEFTADNWRSFLFVPCDAPLRRAKIFVDVSEDGCTIDYAVIDHETSYGTAGIAGPGNVSPVVRIEGTCTTGSHMDTKSMKQAVELVASMAKKIKDLDYMGLAKQVWNSTVPTSACSALVRVIGRRGVLPSQLAIVAMHAALAKFGASWISKKVIVVGAYFTQSLGSEDEPWVELRIELLAPLNLSFAFNPSAIPVSVMKFDTVGVPSLGMDEDSPTVWLGGSNNSRGSYIKSMVVQSLMSAGALPDIPPAPDDDADISAYV